MTYLAITQGTTEWLLGKPALLDELHAALVLNERTLADVSVVEFADGPVRIAARNERDVLAVWNVDYLSGTGEESWGFIKLDSDLGLQGLPDISREVLERAFYVISQRLQGLLLDGAFIHRAQSNETHTCLAGRGSTAREFSIGYFEHTLESIDAARRAVICLGPARGFTQLCRRVAEEARNLPALVAHANGLTSASRRRPIADDDVLRSLRDALRPYTRAEPVNEYGQVEIVTGEAAIPLGDQFRATGFSYEDWLSTGSPLSDVQRRILLSDVIDTHPLRIVGPGGSGKTLLMQLLVVRRLRIAQELRRPVRLLYVTHNGAMAESVAHRFDVLDQNGFAARSPDQILDIVTLAEYGRRQLNLEFTAVIDPDAFEAKQFQLEQVTLALRGAMDAMQDVVAASRLFSEVRDNPSLVEVLAKLVMAEISTAIKGHGLENDKRRYVQSERAFSRFHGVLSLPERQLVFHAFEHYNRAVFEELEVLDTDDIALSLLGRLRTPIWELKRRTLGYDYVFVDETQLFNENERRVLPLLTKGNTPHVPIALALDEAQDAFGQSQSTAGLATLGIPEISTESLASIHRSTRGIVRLAFFVIQRCTDLFGPDFPDFTGIGDQMEPDNHPLATPPRVETVSEDSRGIGKFVLKRIREMRRNLRRVAVICHSDLYWDQILEELKASDLPLHVLLERGAKLPPASPVVVMSRPLLAGGQEFDAVILVGLEQGLVPPRVSGNDALASAVEQQSLRELYLSITRARYRLAVVINTGATPAPVIHDAVRAGLLQA